MATKLAVMKRSCERHVLWPCRCQSSWTSGDAPETVQIARHGGAYGRRRSLRSFVIMRVIINADFALTLQTSEALDLRVAVHNITKTAIRDHDMRSWLG